MSPQQRTREVRIQQALAMDPDPVKVAEKLNVPISEVLMEVRRIEAAHLDMNPRNVK